MIFLDNLAAPSHGKLTNSRYLSSPPRPLSYLSLRLWEPCVSFFPPLPARAFFVARRSNLLPHLRLLQKEPMVQDRCLPQLGPLCAVVQY